MLATWLLVTGVTAQTCVLPPPGGEGSGPLAFPRVEKQTAYAPVEFDGCGEPLAWFADLRFASE